MKKRLIVPLTDDLAFKRIFLKNPTFLKKFITDVLGIDFEIKTLDIKNSELLKSNPKERKKVLDIYVVLNGFYNLSIELNNCNYKYVKIRNFLYLNSIYNSLYRKGEKIKDAKVEVTQLNLNVLPTDDDNLDGVIYVFDEVNNKDVIGNYKIINKNLAYLNYTYYNKNREKEMAWLHVVNATTYEELDKYLRVVLTDEERELFMKEVELMNSEQFLNDYWKNEDINEYVREAELKDVEQTAFDNGFDDGKKVGFDDGKKVGFDDGKKVGFDDGRKVGFNTALNEFIKKMLKNGLELSKVSEISGKSIKEIMKFQKNV